MTLDEQSVVKVDIRLPNKPWQDKDTGLVFAKVLKKLCEYHRWVFVLSGFIRWLYVKFDDGPFIESHLSLIQTYNVTRKTNLRGRLSTVGLHVKVACFVNKVKIISVEKAADLKTVDLNRLMQGGQLYWVFSSPFYEKLKKN